MLLRVRTKNIMMRSTRINQKLGLNICKEEILD